MLNRVLQRIPSKLESSGWLWAQLTTQEHPYHQGDAICSFNLNHYCCLQWFRIFTHLSGFSVIFNSASSFSLRKKGGSVFIGLVLVHQSGSARFGSRAPTLNEGNDLSTGPICQIKWDSALFSSSAFLQGPDISIFSDFYRIFMIFFSVAVRKQFPYSFSRSLLRLSRTDTWMKCQGTDFALICLCVSVILKIELVSCTWCSSSQLVMLKHVVASYCAYLAP